MPIVCLLSPRIVSVVRGAAAFVLFVALAATKLGAQQTYRIERITPDDGLSQSYVYAIHQDRYGFLWFGTRDGITRYDGQTCVNIKHDPRDTTTPSSVAILRIVEDAGGRLWAAGESTIGLLDRRTLRFTDRTIRGLHEPPVTIHDVVADRRGGIVLATSSGLLFGSAADARWQPGGMAPTVSVRHAHCDRGGRIWAVDESWSVHTIALGAGRPRRLPLRLPAGMLDILGQDASGAMVITWPVIGAQRSGLALVDTSTYGTRIVGIEPDVAAAGSRAVTSAFGLDSAGNVWIGVTGSRGGRFDGLYAVPLDSLLAGRNLWPRALQWRRANGEAVLSFLCDRTGVVWVGTTNGVLRIVEVGDRFTTYRSAPDDDRTLSNSVIRAVHKDTDGTLWAGTDNGLNRYDPATRRWHRYLDVAGFGRAERLVVNTVYEDRDGSLLFGFNNGAARYVRSTRRFEQLPLRGADRGLHNVLVRSFLRDRDGRLWVGTRTGSLMVFDANGSRIHTFDTSNGLPVRIVWCIVQTRGGDIWLGSESGAFRWMPKAGRFKRYVHRRGDPASLPGDNVCAITENGGLWFVAHGGGIARYDSARDAFVVPVFAPPMNTLYAALGDGHGRLWLSSNAGLGAYDLRTGELRMYNVGDGVQANEFSFGAYHRAFDGELFFGGINGLTRFRPERVGNEPAIPLPTITSVRMMDTVASAELRDGDTVWTEYRGNHVTFEFASLDYTNPSAHRYAYMLEGFSSAWTNATDRRYAVFTNLDPGEYTFRVKASGNGRWPAGSSNVVLVVVPPFTMTIWFRSIAVLCGVAAVVGVGVARVRVVRRQERAERRQLDLQLQALRLQMNPHFIFNALGSIQHLIVKNDAWAAAEYLSRFARLVRSTLENAREMFIPLAEEIESLELYLALEALRFDGSFDHAIVVDSAIDTANTMIPTMMMQPFVENAIRHGLLNRAGGGSVRVELQLRGTTLRCVVEDNGIGRAAAAALAGADAREHRSLGMRVTTERLAMLSATIGRALRCEVIDLFDESGNAAGTRVELWIPIEEVWRT